MPFRQQLNSWRSPLNPKALVPLQLPKTIDRLMPQLEGIEPKKPSSRDLLSLYQLVTDRFSETGSLSSLSNGIFKRIPWILFDYPESNPGELGDNPELTDEYLLWLGTNKAPSAVANLLRAFLDSYPVHISTFERWRRGISQTIETQSTSQRLTRIRERCRVFHLLTAQADRLFAEILCQVSASPDEILKEAGLAEQVDSSKFILAVYAQVLSILSNSLRMNQPQCPELQRVIDLSTFNNSPGLRFSSKAHSMADAMLLPFSQGMANQNHKDQIRTFLLERLGDPRLSTQHWVSVDNRAKGVMLAWLVESSLTDFFNILSMTAQDMWEARREFWSGYLKRGHIREAWVVLGSQARHVARTNLKFKANYGSLNGAGSDQSVLLLHIGDLVVAEWSHSGACHVWDQEDRHAPLLYKSVYSAQSLRGRNCGSKDNVAHMGDWIPRIRHMIRHHTNIQ